MSYIATTVFCYTVISPLGPPGGLLFVSTLEGVEGGAY